MRPIKNWRTLVAAFFFAFTMNGDLLGLPPRINNIINFIAIIALGYNAKDKSVTGGTDFQGDSPQVAVQKLEQDQYVMENLETTADAVKERIREDAKKGK